MANDYEKARKLGLKEYQLRKSRRESPYLPALAEKLDMLDAVEKVSLGMTSIPVSKIVGTVNVQRANAFAANFMPLLDENTEFGVKWRMLCDSVAKMGVCQPIIAYEYLNRYYVLEGNKRVSVSRYLGAVFIEGEVKRIPARDDGSEEVLLYKEYLPFCEDSGINRLWFTKRGSVERLYGYLGKTPGVRWTDDERAAFLSAYSLFRRAYKAVCGERYSITTGDAFVTYLSVFGYENGSDVPDSELKERIRSLEGEYRRKEDRHSVELVMNPIGNENSATLLRSIMPAKKIRAAFLYNMSPEDSGWNYWHEQGRLYLQEVMGDRVHTEMCICSDQDKLEETIHELAHAGNDLIFTTSPIMLNASVRTSLEHSSVKILNCSLLASYHNVRSYYLRMHEIKFLMGLAAGAMTKTNTIGYIADYPIFGVPASINAFAIGARMVHPGIKIKLAWSASPDFDPDDPFHDPDIHIISGRDVRAPSHTSVKRGLYDLAGGDAYRLASPILDWGKMYLYLVQSYLNGRWNDNSAGARAMDYWWGVSSGALELQLHPQVDVNVRRLVRVFASMLRDNGFNPFGGQMTDQNGVVRCSESEYLNPADILTMDWLLHNVEGTIPTLDEVRPEAKPLVSLQGVRDVLIPDVNNFSWDEEWMEEEEE